MTQPVFTFEHDGDYHRLQVDGGDVVSLQDNGDGTGRIIVYEGSGGLRDPLFEGLVYFDSTAACSSPT